MLLAEIHGKRLPEAEGNEDWLTSAVFGHLRHVKPSVFWPQLFSCAKNLGLGRTSLAAQLLAAGVRFEDFTDITARFWYSSAEFGEPDVILRFTGPAVCPLIVLIEVKLNSTKSGIGAHDQLARYLALLDSPSALLDWKCPQDRRCLIYLTRTFAKREIEESIAASSSRDAANRIFGIEWLDVLECAKRDAAREPLLDEVARFLSARGFEAFRGFGSGVNFDPMPRGGFYSSAYFKSSKALCTGEIIHGRFYGI